MIRNTLLGRRFWGSIALGRGDSRSLTASWQLLISAERMCVAYLQGLWCVFDFLPQKCTLARKRVRHTMLFFAIHISGNCYLCAQFTCCNELLTFRKKKILLFGYSVVWTWVKMIIFKERDFSVIVTSLWFCPHLGLQRVLIPTNYAVFVFHLAFSFNAFILQRSCHCLLKSWKILLTCEKWVFIRCTISEVKVIQGTFFQSSKLVVIISVYFSFSISYT